MSRILRSSAELCAKTRPAGTAMETTVTASSKERSERTGNLDFMAVEESGSGSRRGQIGRIEANR